MKKNEDINTQNSYREAGKQCKICQNARNSEKEIVRIFMAVA